MRTIQTNPISSSEPLGIPPSAAQPQLQTDSYKELINKFAWVLGSTYRVNYSNVRCPARVVARRLATAVIKECGYPRSIAKVQDA